MEQIPKVCRWHPCNQNKRPACSSKLGQTGLMFCLRKVRDSNPRYDVMRTPHFECGSFDHSDNFPFAFGNAFASDADERHKSDACLRSPLVRVLWSKAGAKIARNNDICKSFGKKMHFFYIFGIILHTMY